MLGGAVLNLLRDFRLRKILRGLVIWKKEDLHSKGGKDYSFFESNIELKI